MLKPRREKCCKRYTADTCAVNAMRNTKNKGMAQSCSVTPNIVKKYKFTYLFCSSTIPAIVCNQKNNLLTLLQEAKDKVK